MKILGTAVLSIILHLLLGWAWTLLAGIVGGFWAVRRGWLVGTFGVGLAWAALIGYNFAVASGPVTTMTDTMGGIMGDWPGFATVALTLFIGVLLGLLGGAIGGQIRLFFPKQTIGWTE